MKKTCSALALALLLAGCASTPSDPPPPPGPPAPLEIAEKVEASAVVTQINAAKRTLTLRTADGQEQTVEVSTAVTNFPQIKVGDRVTATYYTAIGAQMRKPGDSTNATVDLGAGRAEAGQRPGGLVAAVQTLPVTIVSVDTATHTVRFFAEDKQVRTITVKRPEAQAYVSKLKAGDEVIITYAEALAIEVKPAQ